MAENSEILEGFLCPICMKDLRTIVMLQTHFEEEHSTEDKDVISSLKDLLGKAKKKIKDNLSDFTTDDDVKVTRKYNFNEDIHSYFEDKQEPGVQRSRWSEFRAIRNMRMDCYAAETNKIIIRLDKILAQFPSETNKQKSREQEIVSWVKDEDVPLCPGCAKTFNLLRRRHHCRLCGAIQCHDCSRFLAVSFARKLTNPAFTAPAPSSSTGNQSAIVSSTLAPLAFLKRSGSNSSLSSLNYLLDQTTGEHHLRVCHHCLQLLERRNMQVESRSAKPYLVQLYENLRSQQEKAAELCPQYFKMADSLQQGETSYRLQDTQELRLKLLRLAENIDSLSKQIASLGVNDPENPTLGTALTLQRKIRLAATGFLKDYMLGMPSLPTPDHLKELQENRRREIEQKIAQERAAALETSMKTMELKKREESMVKHFSTPTKQTGPVNVERGWGPMAIPLDSRFVSEDDPMLQQMQIIRNYIQQARNDNKYDEAMLLETNLKELKEEFVRRQQECLAERSANPFDEE